MAAGDDGDEYKCYSDVVASYGYGYVDSKDVVEYSGSGV